MLGSEKLDKSRVSIGPQKAACPDFGPQQPLEAEYFDVLQNSNDKYYKEDEWMLTPGASSSTVTSGPSLFRVRRQLTYLALLVSGALDRRGEIAQLEPREHWRDRRTASSEPQREAGLRKVDIQTRRLGHCLTCI
jgi:hypothetical protein